MLQSDYESLGFSQAEGSHYSHPSSSPSTHDKDCSQGDFNRKVSDLLSYDLTPNKRAIMEALLSHAIATPSLHQGKRPYLSSNRSSSSRPFSSQSSSGSAFQQPEKHAS